MDWRPIETAPRSGPYSGGTIMLWGPGMSVGIGWWNDGSEYGQESYWVNDCYPDHKDCCEPTHWMPLPDPPGKGQAMNDLRNQVWSAIMGAWYSYDVVDDKEAIVSAVLALPAIRDALNHYAACQSALDTIGEFTVTRENVGGIGGVSAMPAKARPMADYSRHPALTAIVKRRDRYCMCYPPDQWSSAFLLGMVEAYDVAQQVLSPTHLSMPDAPLPVPALGLSPRTPQARPAAPEHRNEA